MRLFILLIGCQMMKSAPLPSPPKDGAPFDPVYTSALLEHYDCNLTAAFADLGSRTNRRAVRLESNKGVEWGGFGAQMCLKWVPRSIGALVTGARLAPDVAAHPWNYGG